MLWVCKGDDRGNGVLEGMEKGEGGCHEGRCVKEMCELVRKGQQVWSEEAVIGYKERALTRCVEERKGVLETKGKKVVSYKG